MTYEERLAYLRRDEGRSVKEIAGIVGKSERTVSRYLNALGLTDGSGRLDVTDGGVLSLWKEGFTIVEIADKFKCSHETVTKRLRKHGISCDRASGIRRHFSRTHGELWDGIRSDLDAGMSVMDVAGKYRISADSVKRLVVNGGAVSVDVAPSGGDCGPGSLGLDGFLARAVAMHGDEYDYSEVEYRNTKTKVRIVCRKHGAFMQTPEKHMQGQGCPLCGDEHMERTNREKYGTDRPLQSGAVREGMVDTVRRRYGVDNPMSLDWVREKKIRTCRERYGVDHTCQSVLVRSKIEGTLVSRYGGRSPFSSASVREKSSDTLFSRYGVRNPMHLPSSIDHLKATCVKRYGTDHVLRLPEFQRKLLDSKKRNGHCVTSRPEESLYARLRERFGEADVLRQYWSPEYPYACDFHVRSRGLFIELNGNWTHGGHWFDAYDPDDVQQLSRWREKSASNRYYASAVRTWSVSDVAKRVRAKESGLNYVVFWDCGLRDADMWFEAGCPDGKDWGVPFSWS